MGAYKGGFSSKLDHSTVLHAELMGIILAMEMALEKGWLRLWVESDSQVAVRASKDHSIVPWNLRNRWRNCFSHQMQLLFSHVYREGNSCADKLAAHGHVITGFLWWDVIPPFIYHDFSLIALALLTFGKHSLGLLLSFLLSLYFSFF
jgi:hypothetical protein